MRLRAPGIKLTRRSVAIARFLCSPVIWREGVQMLFPKGKQNVTAWAAIVHTKVDREKEPPEVELIKEGLYLDPKDALEVASRKCRELHGIGYTIEAYYGSLGESSLSGS